MENWKFGDKSDVPARWDRNRKIEALRPVASVLARKWIGTLSKHGMDTGDIFSAAMMGVVYAVDHYDTKKGMMLKNFAVLCANGKVMDNCEKYNLTKATARKKEQYVTWLPLMFLAGGELIEEVESEWEGFLPDPSVDIEGAACDKDYCEETWGNWSELLTPLQKSVMQEAVLRTGRWECDYAGIAEKLGISRKSVDNALTLGRKKLRAEVAVQGFNPEKMSHGELLALRMPSKAEQAARKQAEQKLGA